MLSRKKIEILLILNRLNIATARQIAKLNKCNEYTGTRKRINMLIEDGYVEEISSPFREKIFRLKSKGEKEVDPEDNSIPKGLEIEQNLLICEFVAWMSENECIDFEDITFGREYSKPEIVIGNSCYVILTKRLKEDKVRSMISNISKTYKRQVWVLPNHFNLLAEKIYIESKYMNTNICVISYDITGKIFEFKDEDRRIIEN